MSPLADPAAAVSAAAAGLRFEDLPARTVASVKRLIVDALAVALAGRGCRDTEALHALAEDWGGRPECAVLGSRLRLPSGLAALVNGTMIQALDFDDTHDPSAAHTASTVLAAALAIGEARRRSGRELVTAVAAGVELVGRLGRASATNIGFTSTAIYGAFGAAIAAARLLGLEARQTQHALGIVLSQAAGTSQTVIDQPLSKHMQSGFAAKAGVLSALLAERGATGIERVFEGKYGFFNLYKHGRYRLEPLAAPWGERFEVDDLSLKPYPSCRGTHAPIQAALALARSGIDPATIARVRVTAPRFSVELAGAPFEEGDEPMIAAQFSIPYTVATALLRGAVTLRHFRPDAIRDPEVRALAKEVTVETGEGTDFTPASVEVELREDRRRAGVAVTLKGSAEEPLTDAELLAKIEDCLAFAPEGCAAIDAAGLQRLVASLDDMDDVTRLVAPLAPAPARTRKPT